MKVGKVFDRRTWAKSSRLVEVCALNCSHRWTSYFQAHSGTCSQVFCSCCHWWTLNV